MKIALVLERFDKLGGGLEQWAWRLTHALAQRGHSVTVVAFDARSEAACAEIRIHRLPWQASRLTRSGVVGTALAEIDAEVVHDLGVGCTADILHPQAGCRVANYEQDLRSMSAFERVAATLDPRKRRWLRELRRLEEKQYRGTESVIVAVSQMVAGDLHYFYGVPPERVRLIPNGVDARIFKANDVAAREQTRGKYDLCSKTLFLFAAHNQRLKGLRPLLAAFSKALGLRSDLCLLVIGKEPGTEYVRLAKRLGIEQSIIFAGFVEDTGPWYAAADACVLPTYYDACSLTVLEACAFGLPVITTRHNGASELMTDGLQGRIIGEADDTGALSAAVLELSDPRVRAVMRTHALELASRCSFQRNVDELERLYLEIARKT